VERAAEVRARGRVLAEAVVTYGLPVDVDAGDALLEEVRRSAGHVRWLAEIIRGLDPEALVWGARSTSRQVGRSVDGPVDVTTSVEQAGLNVWLDLYHRERILLRKVAEAAVRAGIAERQVRLAEADGERAGRWLQATLAVLELSAEDMREVMASGARHLSLLAGGDAAG
jgi:hypothetical protein